MSDDSALFDKVLPIRRAVLGSAYVDRSLDAADDFMMGIQRAATAWVGVGPGATRRSTAGRGP